jgi:hypothetical protein
MTGIRTGNVTNANNKCKLHITAGMLNADFHGFPQSFHENSGKVRFSNPRPLPPPHKLASFSYILTNLLFPTLNARVLVSYTPVCILLREIPRLRPKYDTSLREDTTTGDVL